MPQLNRNEFGFHTTADEVLEGIDLTGKRVLITGASSGLGEETARAIASKGAHIILTARNIPKGETVAQNIQASTGNQQVEVMSLELGSLASIQVFASAFLAKYDSLDILINNAGVMACPQGTTQDGFEMQFGVNHIGHFHLTNLLTPALTKAAPSRIVNLSSRAHLRSPVVFEDIQFENRAYDKWASYGQSKTANILHAVELERRLGSQGVHAYAVHPGGIVTELGRHLSQEDIAGFANFKFKSIPEGAATTCYAATAPELEGKGGSYLFDSHIAEVNDDPTVLEAVRSYALDSASAQQLWELSEQMIQAKNQ